MKKVTTKLKQALSILLAAAMVITMVPQNALSVSAQEEAVETVSQAEDTVLETNEETTDGTVLDGAEVSEETGDTYVTEDTDTAEIEDGDADAPDEEDADAEVYEVNGEEDAAVMQDTNYKINLDSVNENVTIKLATYTNSSWTLTSIVSGTTEATVTDTDANVIFAVNVAEGYELTADGVQGKSGSGSYEKLEKYTDPTKSSTGIVAGTGSDEGKNFTLYTMAPSDAITLTAAAKAITYKLTFGTNLANITDGTQVKNDKVTVTPKDASGDDYSTAVSTESPTTTLAYGKDLNLKIVTTDNYTVDYVGLNQNLSTGNVVPLTAPTDNVYTIDKDDIKTAAATAGEEAINVYVKVSAPVTNYKITVDGSLDSDLTVKKAVYDELSSSWTVSDFTTDAIYSTKSDDVIFAVKAAEGKTFADDDVKIAVGGAGVVAATKNTTASATIGGDTYRLYKISAESMTGDIVISVAKVSTITYTIKFDAEKSNGPTIKLYGTEEYNTAPNESEGDSLTYADAKTNSGLTFKVTPYEGSKITYVGLVNSASDTTKKATVKDAKNGLYQISFAQLQAEAPDGGDVTIYVKQETLATHSITFKKNGETITNGTSGALLIKEVTKQGSGVSATYSLGADIAASGITAKESLNEEDGSVVNPTVGFYLELNPFERIVSVKDAAGTPIATTKGTFQATGDDEAKEHDYYSFAATANAEINIVTALDETKVNTITVKLGDGVEADSVTVKDNADTSAKATVVGDSLTFTTRADSFTLSMTLKDGYQLTATNGVKVGAVNETFANLTDKTGSVTGDESPYTLAIDSLADLTDDSASTARVQQQVVITTERIGTQAEKTITFDNQGTHLTLDVDTTDDKLTQDSLDTNKYTIATGGTTLLFAITASAAYYTPVVKIGDTPVAPIDEEPTTTDDGKLKYSYDIIPSTIEGTTETITITEETTYTDVTVSYNTSEVEVAVADSEGAPVDAEVSTTPDAANTGNTIYTYKTLEGLSYTLTVTPKTNCDVTGVTGATAVQDQNGKYSFTSAKDLAVVVASKANYAYKLSAGSTELTPAKAATSSTPDTYVVDYATEYTITTTKGGAALNLYKVEIVDKDSAVAATGTVKGDGTSTFTIPADKAGANYTVKSYVGKEEENSVVDDLTFDIQVRKAPTSVSVKGASGNAIKQVVDSKQDYELSVTSGASVGSLQAVISTAEAEPANKTEADNAAKAAVTADIADGKLTVTTVPQKPTDGKLGVEEVKLEIFDSADVSESKTALATLTVKIQTSTLTGITPSVSVSKIDSKEMTLTLGAKKAVTPNAGKVYYKLVAKRGDVEYGTTYKPYTVYIEKDAADSQSYALDLQAVYTALTEQKADIITAKTTLPAPYYGVGEAYELTVSLIQTTDAEAVTVDNEQTKTAFTGKKDVTLNKASLSPAYETKLGLTKGTTTVYTGQSDVTVATAKYSNSTSFKYLQDTAVVTYNGQTVDDGVTATVEGDTIKVSAEQGVAVGKYTVTVSADAPATAQPATASVVVTVVKGIEKISVSTPSSQIYKDSGKAASLKLSAPVYNDGTKATTPKAKKVNYSIVNDVTWDASANDGRGGWTSEVASTFGTNVTVKNGTVTVAKDYNPDASANNTFRVKVTAADFTGNETCTYTDPITITSAKMTIAGVYIVKDVENEDGKVEVVAATGSEVTPAELDGTRVIAVTGGALTEGQSYEKASLNEIPTTALSYKSSSKVLTIDADGKVTASYATAKNVKITVAATDGSKASNVLDKLNIVTAQIPAAYGVMVRNNVTWEDYTKGDYAQTAISFKGSTDTELYVQIMKKDAAGEWSDIGDDFYGVTAKVGGGKFLDTTYASAGEYTVLASKAETTLTLSYKDDKGKTVTLPKITITNESLAKASKALSLKVYNNLTAGSFDNTIYVDVTKNPDDYEIDKLKTVAHVELEKSGFYGKTKDAYQILAENFGLNDRTITLDDDWGDFTLELNAKEQDVSIPAGNYKLYVTYGTVNENGRFEPGTQTTGITIKAVAVAKASYKAVTTVKLSAKDKASVQLAGTGKNFKNETYTQDSLKNAVKKNGEANKFTDYFQLDASNNLSLKATTVADIDAAVAHLLSREGADDCIGYVDYSYQDLNGVTYQGTTKLTVKLSAADKTLNSYKAAASTIVAGDTVKKAYINITSGKNAAYLADAYIVSSTDSTFTNVTVGDNGQLILDYTKDVAVGKLDVVLRVLPQDSAYVSNILTLKANRNNNGETTEKAYTDAITASGIEVKATVNVVEAKDAKNKISIAKDDQTQYFMNDDYNAETGAYYTYVPYTKNVPCTITTVTADSKVPQVTFNVDNENADGWIEVKLTKQDLLDAINSSTHKLGSQKAAFGGKITVKPTLKFADGKPDETITLTLILPYYTDDATAEETISYVESWKDDIQAEVVIADYDSAMTGTSEKTLTAANRGSGDHEFLTSIWNTLDTLCDVLLDWAPADSGVSIRFDQFTYDQDGNVTQLTLGGTDFTAPTAENPGSLKVSVHLHDIAAEAKQAGDGTKVEFTIQVAPNPADVESSLTAFVNNSEYTNTLDGTTTADDIATAARTAILKGGYADSSLKVRVEDFTNIAATDKHEGGINCRIYVVDTRYGKESVCENLSTTTAQLQSVDELADLIYTAGDPDTGVLTELTDLNNETTEQDILDAIDDAGVKTNTNINIAFKADTFKITPADADTKGNVEGTLVLSIAGGDSKELPFKLTGIIEKLKDADGVELAVRTAVGALTSGGDYTNTNAAAIKALVETGEKHYLYADIKAAVIGAAQKAIKGQDGWTVAYKTAEANTQGDLIDLTYKAPTSSNTGSIGYTLVLKKDVTEREITVASTTEIAADPILQTLTEAKTAVKDALNASFLNGLDNTATKESVIDAVETKLGIKGDGDAVITGRGITADLSATTVENATVAADGKITIKITLNQAADTYTGAEADSETLDDIEKDLTRVSQTESDAKTAVGTLDDEGSSITFGLADESLDEDGIASKQTAIVNAANALLNQDDWKAEANGDAGLKITQANGTTKGSATITIDIKGQGSNSGTDQSVALTWEWSMASQTKEEALAALVGLQTSIKFDSATENDLQGDGLTSKETAIINKAKEVVNQAEWTVTKKEALAINKATVNADGNATIKLTITTTNIEQGNTDYDTEDQQLTWTLSALDQTLAKAKEAVTEKLTALGTENTFSDNTTEQDVLDAVAPVIKSTVFDLAFDESSGFAIDTTGNKITGTLVISFKTGQKPENSGEGNSDTVAIGDVVAGGIGYTGADMD